ncbi:MAG TPA: succinate dehydrogenase assembly factor 2 [Candidatus Pelagibacter sp.]|jgi:antitoxin CptB|nr:succinate dehydrogenase assembly factor 2 [Candidatus Pelagibacter sp.]
MNNKKKLIKKIIYRSTHRGTKEMDLLIGKFVKKKINLFTNTELEELNNLLMTEDKFLEEWYFDKESEKLPPNYKAYNEFKKFRL